MNLVQIACLLAFCASCQSQEQTYLITAPKLLRVGAAETVVVQIFGYESAFSIDVSFKSFPDKKITYDSKRLELSSDNKFQGRTTLTIQPKDIVKKDDTLFVYLEAKTNSFTKEEKVPITFENGFLFIQTDKPLYTPDQSVKIRVYSLNEELKPSRSTITLTFRDPEGVNVDLLEAEDFTGIVSFVDFKIPANPKFGIWRITAAYKKDFTTTGYAQFEVKEYVLPGFSVSIKPEASLIGYDTFEGFKITIKASYFYNKLVPRADAYVRFGIIKDGERRMLSKAIQSVEISYGVGEVTLNSKTAVQEINYETLEELDGAYLYITVSVLEAPDGHPEESELATVKYVLSPYKLKLIATPLFMRPGLPFYIKVQVRDDLESPVEKKVPVTLTATAISAGQELTTLVEEGSQGHKAETGKQDGTASFFVNVPADANTLEFTLRTADRSLPEANQAVSPYTATAYNSPSKSYLYISWISQHKTLRVGDYVSMDVHPSSHYIHKIKHFSYLVLSKGKIVSSATVDRVTDSSFQSLNIEVTRDMVPSARLLVYYIFTGDGAAELVADSVWMNVEEKCVNDQKVQLSTGKKSYAPGKEMTLSVKAQTGSFIALSAMDTALYGVIGKRKRPLERALRDFEKSDLGCGAGGGRNNADVFNLAGLTFITNANSKAITDADKACSALVRAKREVNFKDEMDKLLKTYQLKDVKKCCKDGIDAYPISETCEERASRIKTSSYPIRCKVAFKKCCDVAKHLRDQLAGKTLELARMEFRSFLDVDNPQIRSYFPESWMWEVHGITERSGSKTLSFPLPDTLTTWEIQGIGMSDQGICVADPVEVQVFKDVFLNVKMPYSVVRGEQIELIGTVYNYRSFSIRCCVTVIVGEEICLFKGTSTKVKGIQSTTCSRPHPLLSGSSIKVVKFKILPLEIGLHKVNFSLIHDYGSEIVVQSLRVVPEGIKKEKQDGFTLDPQGVYGPVRRRQEFRYLVPPNVVPKSKVERTLSVEGLLLGNVIATVLNPEGVKLLTNLPKGSGETELMRVVPIIYVFHYLDTLGDWELLGPKALTSRTNMRRQMKQGMLSLLSFRNPDFSYSMWPGHERSTWLTAFALRIIGQVHDYVPLEQMSTCNTLIWVIEKCQKRDGSFEEKSSYLPVKLQGTLPKAADEKTLYLTAFVLIGIQKAFKICPTVQVQDAINRAEEYLHDSVRSAQSTFTLAIATFALALTDYSKKGAREAFATLKTEAFVIGASDPPVYRFWKGTYKAVDSTTPNDGTAQIVETTAYALLAALHHKEVAYANPIVNWLSKEQRFGGGFYATQDTLNGLEALAEYAILQKKLPLDMVVRAEYRNLRPFQRYELKQEKYFTKPAEILLAEDLIISTGSGTGLAIANVRTVYHVISTSSEICSFDLKIGRRKDRRFRRQTFERPSEEETWYLEACAKFRPNARDGLFESGSSVMEISLVTGLEAVEDDLSVLASGVDQLISDYSLTDGNVIIHLERIPSDKYLCVAFRVKEVFKVGMLTPSTFKVYDFYAPDKQCTIFYNPYGEDDLVKLCQGNECSCMEAQCSQMQQNMDLTISAEARKEKACQKDVVYAYRINIVSSAEDGSFIKYTAALQDIFKKGEALVKANSEVKFIKKKSCTDVVLDQGKQYLMMGKEGIRIQVGFSFQYEYPLDAAAWIEWWPSASDCNTTGCHQFLNVMEDFSEDILFSGC